MGSFQIPSTPPTTNKTIRFPNDVVEAVEKAIQGRNCTFSAFVIAAVRAALEDIKQKDEQCDAAVLKYLKCTQYTGQYNPNLVFPIGDGFGLFVFFQE